MSKHYPAHLLCTLRNQIPINAVIIDILRLDLRKNDTLLRFRCPLCGRFHTATNPNTNLARCFNCKKNFNPIDLVMSALKYSFVDAVELLKEKL